MKLFSVVIVYCTKDADGRLSEISTTFGELTATNESDAHEQLDVLIARNPKYHGKIIHQIGVREVPKSTIQSVLAGYDIIEAELVEEHRYAVPL